MGVATQQERRLLILLAFVSFVVMATEVVPVGIATVFTKQQGVGDGATGLLVITYALGVAVAGPLLTLTVVKVDQRLLLSTLIGAFAISQAMTAIAPTMPLILAARSASGLIAGATFAAVTVVAYRLAARGSRGKALGTVALGISLATVIAAPASNLLANGLGWRAPFWILALMAAFTLLPLRRLLGAGQLSDIARARQLRSLLRPGVRSALSITVLVDPALFCAYTYLVSLVVARGAGDDVAFVLIAFGLGAASGTALGGRAFDRSPRWGLIVASATTGVSLLALALAGSAVPMVVGCFFFGLGAFAAIPILQGGVLHHAPEAPLIAAAVNVSVFNLANAIGAGAGAIGIAAFGPAGPAFIGGFETLGVAAILSVVAVRGARRSRARRVTYIADQAPGV
jgi:MFS transporter, DHA1 family, inner membrane transport protein